MSVERTVRVNLVAANQQYNRAMQQSGRETQNTSKQMGGMGAAAHGATRQLMGMAAPLLGATGVVRGLRSAANAQVEFQDSALALQTQIGLTAGEADRLAGSAREVGVQYGIGAQQAIDASWQIASAGLRGQDAAEALERSAAAAALGFGDVTTVADLATSAMNAYGPETLSAADATDILATAIREGKAQPEEMAASMGQVLPIAAELGVEFHELAGVQAGMTRTGTNAATAATQLRQVMMDLLNPSQQARDTLEEVGLSAQGLRDQIREEGLFATLMTLREAFEGNEEAMSNVFGNARSLMGVLDLMGENVHENAQIMEAMANATGAIDDGLEILQDRSTRFQMDRFKANIQEAVLGQGELSSALRFTTQTMNEWMESARRAADTDLSWVDRHFGSTGGVLRTIASPRGASDAITSPLRAQLSWETPDMQREIKELQELAEAGDYFAHQTLQAMLDGYEGWRSATVRSVEATLEATGAQDALAQAVHSGSMTLREAQDAALLFGTTSREVAIALQELRDADLEDVGLTLGRSIGGVEEAASDASDELEWLASRVESGSMSMAAAEVVAGLLGIELYELEAALGVTADAADEAADSYDGQAESAYDARDAIDAYLEASRRAVSPVLQLRDAVQKVREAEEDYQEALKEHGPTSKEAEDAAWDLLGAIASLEGVALDADLSFDEFRGQLQEWVRQGHLTDEQAKLILGSLSELNAEADAFEGDRHARFVADFDLRISQADMNLLNRWEAMGRAHARGNTAPSRSSSGGGSTSSGAGHGTVHNLHSGGWVGGSGPTALVGHGPVGSDERLILGQAGEFMVNRRAASQHGELLQAINTGRVTSARAGGAGPAHVTHVTHIHMIDGREVARSAGFIDELSRYHTSEELNTAGAAGW